MTLAWNETAKWRRLPLVTMNPEGARGPRPRHPIYVVWVAAFA